MLDRESASTRQDQRKFGALGGSVNSPKMSLNRGDWAEFGHADTEHRAEA
jgi:hypothetical protein